MSVKIMIMDNNQMACECLQALLENQPGMEVACRVSKMTSDSDESGEADVMILCIDHSDAKTLAQVKHMVSDLTYPKIIVMAIHMNKDSALEMLKAGIAGVLLNESSVEEVIMAVKTVLSNKMYLSSEIITRLIDDSLVFGPGKQNKKERCCYA